VRSGKEVDWGNREHLETTRDGHLPKVLNSPIFEELWFPEHKLDGGKAGLETLSERVRRSIAEVIA
jgi:hypothetical protein